MTSNIEKLLHWPSLLIKCPISYSHLSVGFFKSNKFVMMQIYIAIWIFRVFPFLKTPFLFFIFFFFGQAIGQGKKSVIQRFTRQVDAQLFWRRIVHVKKNHDIKSGSGGSWGVYWLNAISQCVPLIDLLRKSHK